MHLIPTKILTLTCLLIALVTSAQVLSNTTMKLKTTDVDFYNQALERPTQVKFWYQSNVNNCKTIICLSSQQQNHRIAVISHGAFGSPREMNWLGYALASQGWIVAGIAHFGESWVYGTDNIDPMTAMRFWQRPQDVSFVLDRLSDETLFNKSLKIDNVIMLGHSSGGFTSLAMVGATLDAERSQRYCGSQQGKLDKGCHYGKTVPLSAEQVTKIGLLQAQMIDQRVSAVVALDPALGHATSENSLRGITLPTLIVGSVENDFLPYSVHAEYFAGNIKGANLAPIEDGAGHFVYLDKCDSERKTKGVYLCKDRRGVDRNLIQKQILGKVFAFIYENGLG